MPPDQEPVFPRRELLHRVDSSAAHFIPGFGRRARQSLSAERLAELERESIAFWEKPLNVAGRPFTSQFRMDILIQLRDLGLNPIEWQIDISGFGKVHYRLASRVDEVENCVGEMVHAETRQSLDVYFDWVSSCDSGLIGNNATCPNATPDQCNFRGFIALLRNTFYDPNGKPIED